MSAATEVVAKMHALRTGLGVRMRHLDALHASLTPPPASYHPAHPPSTTTTGPPMLPLYARPHGPPPAPVYSRGAPHPSQYAMQHGHVNPHAPTHAPPHLQQQPHLQQPYWGLEGYYHAQEEQRLASIARPPEYEHIEVYGLTKGITAVLDDAFAHLNAQLPPSGGFKFAPRAPAPSPSLAEATAAAATKVILSPRPEPTPRPKTPEPTPLKGILSVSTPRPEPTPGAKTPEPGTPKTPTAAGNPTKRLLMLFFTIIVYVTSPDRCSQGGRRCG
jgi:hypothetical protein